MSEDEGEILFEGIVHASSYNPDADGKQFLGAVIEDDNRTIWVVEYGEASPYHPFAGRRVMVSGRPYQPDGQCLIGWRHRTELKHLRVLTMRLAVPDSDAWLIEVGPAQDLSGRIERGSDDAGAPSLSFVNEQGDTFRVANDPPGVQIGCTVDVRIYHVLLATSSQSPRQVVWLLCWCSAVDVWGWRRRSHAGLPPEFHVDAESGQVRRRKSV
jgi:hypothetical protein